MANLGGSGGIYGSFAPKAMYPGDTALLIGQAQIYGFFGSGGTGTPSGNLAAGSLPENGKSSPVVIASKGVPSSQRQLTWRISSITGTVSLNLQVADEDVDGSYVTIDSVSGASSSTTRVIGADTAATGTFPGAQSSLKNLSTARFIRVVEGGSGTAVCLCEVTCQ